MSLQDGIDKAQSAMAEVFNDSDASWDEKALALSDIANEVEGFMNSIPS
jgi:hypothetical protein